MPSEKNDLVPSAIADVPVLNDQSASEVGGNDNDDKASKHEPEDDETSRRGNGAVIPLKYRLTAVAMILFISTGTAFAEVTMGPLKSTLQRELGLNSKSHHP